jgi:hypothetical protein
MSRRIEKATLAAAVVAAGLVLTAPPALAQNCKPENEVPPGNSELDQYVETVPGACGDERPDGASGGGSGSGGGTGASGGGEGSASDGSGGGSSIPSETRRELERLGGAGAAAAAVADATAPADVDKSGNESASDRAVEGDGSAEIDDAADDEGSVFGALASVLTGDSAAGLALPLALIAILIGGLAFWALKRRRAS